MKKKNLVLPTLPLFIGKIYKTYSQREEKRSYKIRKEDIQDDIPLIIIYTFIFLYIMIGALNIPVIVSFFSLAPWAGMVYLYYVLSPSLSTFQMNPLFPKHIDVYLGEEGYCMLGTNTNPSKGLKLHEFLIFKDVKQIDLISAYGDYRSQWQLFFYNEKDQHLLTLTHEHPSILKSIEIIVTKEIYKRTKNKNIFFTTNNQMYLEYQSDKHDGIGFKDNELYIIKNSQKHQILTSKISTKYGLIHFSFGGGAFYISFQLDDFTNSRLLLQLISEKFDLHLPLMLHARGEGEPYDDLE